MFIYPCEKQKKKSFLSTENGHFADLLLLLYLYKATSLCSWDIHNGKQLVYRLTLEAVMGPYYYFFIDRLYFYGLKKVQSDDNHIFIKFHQYGPRPWKSRAQACLACFQIVLRANLQIEFLAPNC